MKHYQINIESKSEKYLEKFLTFFSKSLKNYNLINKSLKNNKKRKILSILKSPHVNKKAQEQFQSDSYSKKINLYSTQNVIALLFIKKISSTVFSNVKVKIQFPINVNLIKTAQTKILNPTNFKLNFLNQKSYLNEITRENTQNILSKLKQEKIKNVLLKLKQEKIKNVLILIFKKKKIKNVLLSLIKKKKIKNILIKLKRENTKNSVLKHNFKKTINVLFKLKTKKLTQIKQLFELLDIYGELIKKSSKIESQTKFR